MRRPHDPENKPPGTTMSYMGFLVSLNCATQAFHEKWASRGARETREVWTQRFIDILNTQEREAQTP